MEEESVEVKETLLSEEESDQILKSAYDDYCRVPEEMDANDFKKMCRELSINTKKFTALDVDTVFKKTIVNVEALNDGDVLKDGVVFGGKRIKFKVYRNITIGLTARARGATLDELISIIRENFKKK